MSDVQVGKEADHHPYKRPRDAATLMLVDRSGTIPKVLVGKRHANVVFMPGKYVFPGQVVARDGYAEAVAERAPVWALKRRSAQEAGREIRAVLANITERLG